MAIKVPNTGEVLILQELIAYLNSLVIDLYQNNYTPVDTSLAADFTVATFDGYAQKTLDTFAAAFLNGNDKAETDHLLLTWVSTGVTANTIYGYYVRTSGGLLVYAERNPTGGTLIDAIGESYSILPRFTLATEL